MKRPVALLFAFACIFALGAQEGSIDKDDPIAFDLSDWTEENLPILTLTPSVAATYEYGQGFSTRETFDLTYLDEHFALTAMVSVNNDNEYTPDIANTPAGDLWGNYLLMESGGLAYRIGGLLIRAGRLPHYDVIDSPYSLFISSLGHSTNIIEINYERGRFFYQSRYISLNADSNQVYFASEGTTDINGDGSINEKDYVTWPDRGANLKVYGFRFGDMRFGVEDMAVYCGTAFDWEYLVNPSIGYLIQYVRGTNGRPWSTGANDNYAIGAFWEWERQDDWDFNAQFFLDDGNTHWLDPDAFPDIPFKLSITAGARKKTSIGSFGLYTAGSTKYNYQATLTELDNVYSYTYYPDVIYDASEDGSGDWTMIDYEDTYLGYKYGENNLAFLGEYRGSLVGFNVGADLEFTVDGKKGPSNPWNEEPQSPDAIGSHWLDDDVLQYQVTLTAKASRRFGNFVAFGSLKLGYVWNKIDVNLADAGTYGVRSSATPEEEAVDQYMLLYTPQEGDNEPIIKVSIGGKYILPLK